MALNDAALVLAANAVDGAITHMQLHSGARGAAGTSNVTSAARVAVNGTVDGAARSQQLGRAALHQPLRP